MSVETADSAERVGILEFLVKLMYFLVVTLEFGPRDAKRKRDIDEYEFQIRAVRASGWFAISGQRHSSIYRDVTV